MFAPDLLIIIEKTRLSETIEEVKYKRFHYIVHTNVSYAVVKDSVRCRNQRVNYKRSQEFHVYNLLHLNV